MDIRDFLRRVIPKEGNYLTLCYPVGEGSIKPDSYRSFPVTADGFSDAVGYARWLVEVRKVDVWHAVAAFKVADTRQKHNGQTVLRARRVGTNVHLIKCLIIDQDVKQGAFASRQEAAAWLYRFCTAVGLPMPNLGVRSGYGLHWYWLLETALAVNDWKPLAEALRRAMTAHGWTADTSPTVDAARLLRPPSTLNFKVRNDPKPVVVLPQQAADYPNDLIVQALTPWLGVSRAATGTSGAVINLGPRPVHAAGGANLNPAATEGIPQRGFSVYEMGKKCLQVQKSLATNGEGEDYSLWTAHALTCVRCDDGEQAIHDLSSGWDGYTEEETSEKYNLTLDEAETKGLGATTCKRYDEVRSGVCQQCKYWGNIPSPLRLGAPESDLPPNYRRVGSGYATRIEVLRGNGDDAKWELLFDGNVHSPQLDELTVGSHQLQFVYEAGIDKPKMVAVPNKLGAPATIQGLLADQGFTVATPKAALVGAFLVAWINKLQRDGEARHGRAAPYGWNMLNGKRLGVAIAGDHYLCAGGEEKIAVSDRQIASSYRPIGTLEAWRQAAKLFEGRRPDLQIAIALSFAAPLLSLCSDIHGVTFNFFSTASGIGKTSVFRVGQTIWGSIDMISSMNDTLNATTKRMSEPKIFPRYWDEFMINRDSDEKTFDDLLFKTAQGRDKARMQANTELRETGNWRTFLILSANQSFTDLLSKFKQHTDAGMFRLFEIELPKISQPFSPQAGVILNQVEANYGHAGRVFLRHLATHHDEIECDILAMIQGLTQKLNAQQAERFYIAAMACIMVGAYHARKLSLFDFDLEGIRDELRKAFLAARTVRTANAVVTDTGTFDVVQVISNMYADFANERIVTNRIATRAKQQVTIVGRPRTNTVWMQLSIGDQLLRIVRSKLYDWLHDNKIPSKIILKDLERHGAIVDYTHRGTLAAGTAEGYSTGQCYVIDIPLTGAFKGLLEGQRHGDAATPA